MLCRHVFGNISGGFRGISRFLGNFAGFRGNTWISRVRDRAKYQKPCIIMDNKQNKKEMLCQVTIYMWKKNIPDYTSTGHGNICKNTIGLSIKRLSFTSSVKKTIISPPIFTLFQNFFLYHRDHIKTFTLSQKSKF